MMMINKISTISAAILYLGKMALTVMKFPLGCCVHSVLLIKCGIDEFGVCPDQGLLIWYHKQLVALCITWLATSLYQTWPEVEVSIYSDACYGVVAFTTYLLLGLGMQYSETAADQLCVLPSLPDSTFFLSPKTSYQCFSLFNPRLGIYHTCALCAYERIVLECCWFQLISAHKIGLI